MERVVATAYWNSSVAKQAPRFILLIRLSRLPKLLETEPSFEEQQLGLPLEIQISLKVVAKRLPSGCQNMAFFLDFYGFRRTDSDWHFSVIFLLVIVAVVAASPCKPLIYKD
jgi:hypothetical protein